MKKKQEWPPKQFYSGSSQGEQSQDYDDYDQDYDSDEYQGFPPIFNDVDETIWDKDAEYQYHKRFTDEIDLYFQQRSKGQRLSYPVFEEQQCYDQIKQSIRQDMYEDGFDLMVTNMFDIDLPSKYRVRKLYTPKFYMRFQCENCYDPRSSKKQKNNKNLQFRRWTTSKGTVTFQYQIIPLNIFNQAVQESDRVQTNYQYSTPFMILISLKLYKMRCLQCNEWGKPFLYKPGVMFLKDKFCQKLSDIMKGKYKQMNKNQKLFVPKLIDHKRELCQACQEGICDYQSIKNDEVSNRSDQDSSNQQDEVSNQSDQNQEDSSSQQDDYFM